MANLRRDLNNTEIFLSIKEYCRDFLESSDYKDWLKRAKRTRKLSLQILRNSKFKEGSDLSSEQLDNLFRHLRMLSHNQVLNKSLYKANEIDKFNSELRNLLYGSDSLPVRIESFHKLERVGEQTASQFLVMYDWIKYPLSTSHTRRVLNLNKSLIENATNQAIEKYNITIRKKFSRRTMRYLSYIIIYENMKDLLNLDNLYQLNIILWRYGDYAKRKGHISRKKEGITVFVSYATKDNDVFKIPDVVTGLKSFVKIKKVLYWQEDVNDNITKYMNDNIDKCDVFILFCSPNALKSKPIEDEWTAANTLRKPIIPVFIKKDHIPPLLSPKLGVEFDQFNFQNNVDNIHRVILKKLKGN